LINGPSPNETALNLSRSGGAALDVDAAGTEAKMNARPAGKRHLEPLRDSRDDMRMVIDGP